MVLTFQGQSFMQAPGGVLQLCVLSWGQLWWSRGQQMWVGVWLDGGQRRIVGIGRALLHWEEGAARFGASHFDSSLIAWESMVVRRGCWGLLGDVSVEEQLVVRGDWLPVAGLGLLSLELLLFAPHVVQQHLAVAASPSWSTSPSGSSHIAKSVICPRTSVCRRLGIPEHSGTVHSSGPRDTVYPQSSLLSILLHSAAVQETVRAVTVTSGVSSVSALLCDTWITWARGGGVLRAGGRVEGEGGGMGERERPEGWKIRMVGPERDR